MSIHFHIKPKNISKKLKKNSVTIQTYSNKIYLRNQLRNLSLILQNPPVYTPCFSWGAIDFQKTLPGKASDFPLLDGVMTRTSGGFCFMGKRKKKISFQLFDPQIHFFPSNLSTTMVGYKGLTEDSTKVLEGDNALRRFPRSDRIYPWDKSWRTKVVTDNVLVYHFFDPNLGIKIFFERGGASEQWHFNF